MVLPVWDITPEEWEKHNKRIQPVPRGGVVKYSLVRSDPVYFAVNMLGIKPYSWQARFLDNMALGKNTIVCSARQVGKTLALAIFALWACVYNRFPLETTKKTRIVIVSSTDEQSKKIIGDVRELIQLGDEYVFTKSSTYKTDKRTGKRVPSGGVPAYFSNKLSTDKKDANRASTITFANGCRIESYPPTDRARGNTGSVLLLDEAAFMEDDVFTKILKPIVAKTGNRLFMTSTPNGQQGFFFRYFDPDDKLKLHEFERLWIPYTSLKLDDPQTYEARKREEKLAFEAGSSEHRNFLQEHMASFNASGEAFFDSEVVESCVDDKLSFEHEYGGLCDVGVDFGKQTSRTVVSIVALEKVNGEEVIRLLYQYEYPSESDLSLIEDLKELKRRFNIQRFIFEDCPQAAMPSQLAEREGLNVKLFVPQREKASTYFEFRRWLMRGRIVFPRVKELIVQMKGLVEEEGKRSTKIYHGAGLRDDRIDSFVIASKFYLEQKPKYRFWDWDEV